MRTGGNPFFTEPLLAVVAGLDALDLKAALGVLCSAEFIVEVPIYPAPEYACKQPLTQEVALGWRLRELPEDGAAIDLRIPVCARLLTLVQRIGASLDASQELLKEGARLATAIGDRHARVRLARGLRHLARVPGRGRRAGRRGAAAGVAGRGHAGTCGDGCPWQCRGPCRLDSRLLHYTALHRITLPYGSSSCHQRSRTARSASACPTS